MPITIYSNKIKQAVRMTIEQILVDLKSCCKLLTKLPELPNQMTFKSFQIINYESTLSWNCSDEVLFYSK